MDVCLTEVKFHVDASQKHGHNPLLQILKMLFIKDFRFFWEFNANVTLYVCRWYCEHF